MLSVCLTLILSIVLDSNRGSYHDAFQLEKPKTDPHLLLGQKSRFDKRVAFVKAS